MDHKADAILVCFLPIFEAVCSSDSDRFSLMLSDKDSSAVAGAPCCYSMNDCSHSTLIPHDALLMTAWHRDRLTPGILEPLSRLLTRNPLTRPNAHLPIYMNEAVFIFCDRHMPAIFYLGNDIRDI